MSDEIKGSVVRRAMMDEVSARGEHMGAAMIACAVLALAEAVRVAGTKVTEAMDRRTRESGRQWGYDKPRIR